MERKEILEELRKELPMDVWSFRKLIEEKTHCKFYYDESAEPSKALNVTKSITLMLFDREFNDLVCEESTVTIEFKNAIYVDDADRNMIYIVHYDL